MPGSEQYNSWLQIQEGVRETEKLMSQKKYNLSMIKARQTLEFMVKCLTDKYNISHDDLIDSIEDLYQIRVISKSTYEHYNKIRIIGNKATHEGDNNAYNANTAYHLLSQEVFTFSNDYSPRKKVRTKAMEEDVEGRNSNRNQNFNERPSNRSSSYPNRQRRRRRKQNNAIRIIVPIVIIIVLVAFTFLLRAIFGGKKNATHTTATAIATVNPTVATSSVELSTTAALESSSSVDPSLTSSEESSSSSSASSSTEVYKTNSKLNVRSAPSTDSTLLGTLESGVTVDYVKKHNDEWAVIRFEGTAEAYVASKYLTKQ
jgi:SH3 domain protein